MAELAYAHDSGSCPGFRVWVQVPSTALIILAHVHTWVFLLKGYYGSLLRKMLALAETIAVNAHKSQLDKGGHPYINHPRFVSAHCTSPESRIVGMLHDVVEDTDVTLDALREYGFNEDILMAIDLVTKKKGPDYDEDLYYEKIKTNSIAREVKLADLKHNSDISRIPHPTKRIYRK